jgi:hypothetical protein
MATTQLELATPESAADAVAVLGEREVSKMTGCSIDKLRYLWLIDMGPVYIEKHGCVRCTVADVLKWQAQRRAAHARLVDSYRAKR